MDTTEGYAFSNAIDLVWPLVNGAVGGRSSAVTDRRTGRFLGLPYDWRPLTRARVRQRWWNPDDRRILTPKAFGWGYDLNLHEVACRLRLRRRA